MLLHPFIVHFTIVLLSIAVLIDFLYLVSKKEKHWKMAEKLLITGVICSIISVFTGNQAFYAVEISREVRPLVLTHESSGYWTMALFLVLLLLRTAFHQLKFFEKPVKWVYYGWALLALAFLLRTGLLGGNMAYIHGVGAEKNAPAPVKNPSFEEE